MPDRVSVAILTVLAAFAGGLVSSRLLERNASAQTAPFASTVYVPSDGLVFRTFEGRVIARLYYDARGGVFEAYDNRERPAASLRVGSPASVVQPAVSEAVVPSSTRALDLGY